MPEVEAVRSDQEVREAIENIDLEPIKVKLMDKDEGQGWTLNQANEIEVWYRRFLFLSWKHQEQSIVPNKLVDKFWHQHILDTRKYAEDCERIFGFFFHHFPYFGMRGAEDKANLDSCFTETNELFVQEFGAAMPIEMDGSGSCDSCGKDSCSHSGWCSKCDGRKEDIINNKVRPTLATIGA